MTDSKRQADDLKAMIKADRKHLKKALDQGNRNAALMYVDSIIFNQRQLKDITGK